MMMLSETEAVINNLQILLTMSALNKNELLDCANIVSWVGSALELIKTKETEQKKLRECLSSCIITTDFLLKAIDKVVKERDALIRAQQPRVMTREEFGEWCKLPDFERKPVVIENRRTNSLVWCWWAAVAPDHDMTVYRIWTAWPTEEQREETAWEE